MVPELTILTSLPPTIKRVFDGTDNGFAYQVACIDSWLRVGADVISLNSQREIEALKQHRFPVKFITSLHERPTINEFLQAASSSRTPLVGIINADCMIFNYENFLLPSIWTGAKDGFVLAERVNIDPATLLPTGQTCLGFDCMFFNRDLASAIRTDEELAVGQPWWDYWLPLEMVVAGKRLYKLQFPTLFHLDHEQGWSHSRWLYFGRKLLSYLDSLSGAALPHSLSFNRFMAQVGTDDLGGFGDWCYNWLQENSTPIRVPGDGSIAKLHLQMMRWVTDFDGMHDATIQLAAAKREIYALTALAQTVDSLREGYAETEKYARHLEKETELLQDGAKALHALNNQLKTEVGLLREAHAQAEKHAKILEKNVEEHVIIIGTLQKEMADLRKAHADAENHVLFQDQEIERLKRMTKQNR